MSTAEDKVFELKDTAKFSDSNKHTDYVGDEQTLVDEVCQELEHGETDADVDLSRTLTNFGAEYAPSITHMDGKLEAEKTQTLSETAQDMTGSLIFSGQSSQSSTGVSDSAMKVMGKKKPTQS